MITILKGKSVEVHWRIIRTENKITEDFTGAELRVFLVGSDNVYPLECGVEAVDGYNEIRFAVNSEGLSTGVYDLKAVWVKNKHSIPDVVNNQFMSVSRRGGVLAVTNDPSEVTPLPPDKTIKLMSYVESYGRDGMSAYELAAFRGVLPDGMSEEEWAGQENVRLQNEAERKAAEDARREAEGEREANERLREQGEAVRVSAEAAREAAEGVREATFQTNEAAREAEFGEAIQAAKDNLVVVNDLTTGGADKALSAEMGKELNSGYQFMGVATLSTKPNTTVVKKYYEASAAGEYPNFGGIVVYSGEVAHLKWDGTSWSKEVSASGDIVYPALRNGSPENSGNSVAIRGNQVIPVRKGDCVYAKFNVSLKEGEKLLYCFSGVKTFTKTADIGENRTEGRSYGKNDIESNKYVITSDDTVGVIVWVVKKNADGTYGSLQPYTDHEQGSLEVCVVRAIGPDIENIIDSVADNSQQIESINDTLGGINRRFEAIGLSSAGSITRGGAGNGSNSYKVRTSGIDVRGIKNIKLYTDRPNAEGAAYRYEYIFSSDVSSIGAYYSGNMNPDKFTLIGSAITVSDSSKYIDVPDNAASVVVAICEIPSDGKEGDIILEVTDFENYKIGFIQGPDTIIEEIQNIKDALEKLNTSDDAYSRNIHKTIALGAACRQRKSSNTSKDFQIIEVTDSHDDTIAVDNAVTMTNGFKTVDAIIHCGDMAGDYMTPQSTMTEFINSMKKSIKPWFNVVGNHEAGTYNMVGYVPSIQHMYNILIAPIVEAGHLIEGEYQVGKCHYFHDFSEHKIRLICVNEYDGDLAFDTEYWEAVPYDSSATAFAFNTQYYVGNIVKIQDYTEYCFRCVKSAITGSSIYGLSGQEPKYKIRPGSRMISQEQAEWFVDTLKSTPEGYAVIIAMHNPFSDKAVVDVSKKFSENRSITGSASAQNAMENDFFADIVDAFIKGLQYSEYISFKGSASYRNVNTAPNGTQYVYHLNADFSQKQANTKFMCYLGGHVHNDLIWHHPTYNEQWQVTPICAVTSYHQSPGSDIRRSNIDDLDYDSITCISFNTSDRAISLVKIGVDVTENMEYRDFEKIVL